MHSVSWNRVVNNTGAKVPGLAHSLKCQAVQSMVNGIQYKGRGRQIY